MEPVLCSWEATKYLLGLRKVALPVFVVDLPPSIWQCNPRGTTSGPTKYSWRQNSFPKDLRGKSFPVVCRRSPRCRVSYGKKARRVTYVGLRKRSSHTLENKTIHSTILAQGKEEKWVAFPKTRTLPSRNFQPNCVKSTRRNGCSHGGKNNTKVIIIAFSLYKKPVKN